MKYIVYKGTPSQPDSYRLAPHPRFFTDEPVEVSADLAKKLLTIDGFKATTKPKASA